MPMRSPFRHAPALLAGAAVVGCALPAVAQQAADNCASAPLVGPGTYTGSTASATPDGAASCTISNGRDVWYRVIPETNGVLVVDTCTAASYDTVLSIHSGCPGNASNQLACDDDGCGIATRSRVQVDVEAGQTYYIRVAGYSSAAGSFTLTIELQDPPPPGSGPDVVYQAIQNNDIANFGPIGGVRAYMYATGTCNRGNVNLLWTNNGTPGIAFNAYRLHNGRLVQLGQSWVKTACCAATYGSCGGRTCNGASGTQLGSGCLDVYGASWNATQTRLMARSQINPWTGQFGTIPAFSGNAIDRRLQVAVADVSPTTYPGALYFAEGVFVADDEQSAEAKHNNASYQRVAIDSSGAMSAIAGAAMQVGIPAIQAWHDHGLGPNTPDPSVVVQQVDVPEEGRFWVAHKTADNGDGTWRYEYAVFNLNSHVSGGSFSIPVPEGVSVSNVGFHDVNYHSGEPYDNTDWVVQVGSGSVTWRSPQTFAQNPNTNALRWGTMYNFWFDADAEPTEGQATLGLFRPYTPDSVQFAAAVPSAAGGGGCATDFNGDLVVNSTDISAFLSAWLLSINEGTMDADFNGDLTVNSSDISAFLTVWLEEVNEGC